ncbi:MAG: hypothetical protein AAF582_02990 [Pseudomonadota bacterium]
MSNENALDLSAIDPPIWRILVHDVVYGPYTLGQMRGFVDEGRLSLASKVATTDGSAFAPALEYRELRTLFDPAERQAPPARETAPVNYMITLQTNADGRRAAIAVLNALGQFSELMPGCFILHSATPVLDLRNQLATVLAERGRFVIVNADTGQLAWTGLGPDADAHAKMVWKRPR